MDGYALRAADAGLELPVTQRIPAGTVGQPLAAGEAARIFTVPRSAGADAVVMQEQTELVDGRLRVRAPSAPASTSAARAKTCARAASCCRPARAQPHGPWPCRHGGCG